MATQGYPPTLSSSRTGSGPGLVWSSLVWCGSGLVQSGVGLVWFWSGLVRLWSGPGLLWCWSGVGLVLVWSGEVLVLGWCWSGPGLVWWWSCVGLGLGQAVALGLRLVHWRDGRGTGRCVIRVRAGALVDSAFSLSSSTSG